jgi:hypothetical protein
MDVVIAQVRAYEEEKRNHSVVRRLLVEAGNNNEYDNRDRLETARKAVKKRFADLRKELTELKRKLKIEEDFTASYIRRLHESEKKREEWQAIAEKAIDASSDAGMVLPATRVTKISPIPAPTKVSVGVRASEQHTMVAKGAWPAAKAWRRVVPISGRIGSSATKRRLPSINRAKAWSPVSVVFGGAPCAKAGRLGAVNPAQTAQAKAPNAARRDKDI